MNIVDDYSGYNWTRLLKAKSDALPAFRSWQMTVENQTGEVLRSVLTDNGELRSTEMTNWCADRGVTHLFTAPHTSAQNGRVERLHRTIMDKARTMRLACNAPLNLWDEFVTTASYLTTLTASQPIGNRTPYKLWHNRKPSIAHLREIGCRAFVLHSGNTPKIAARAVECVMIGYAPNTKAYRCWERHSGRIVELYHVRFIEHLDATPHALNPGVLVNPLTDSDPESDPDAQPADATAAALPEPGIQTPSTALPRCSARAHVPAPTRQETSDGLEPRRRAPAATSEHAYFTAACIAAIAEAALLVDVEDPDAPTWREALASDEREQWLDGARAEIRSLEDMSVFELIPRSIVPRDRKVLRGKFVCRLKRDETGAPVRHKVRWVAKGFQQIWGRDFTDTTSPTARLESFRIIAHIAACRGWGIEQYDVKTAFLNGILPDDEVQFMEQPPGFVDSGNEHLVWRLRRALYGMRQSSRIWNKTLNASFLKWGFTRADCEWCIYTRHRDSATTIVAVHVDDMAATSSTDAEAALFRSELESAYQISALGEAKLVVGIALRRNKDARTIDLSQTALIDQICRTYQQTDAKPASTPIAHGAQLIPPHPQTPLDEGEQERLESLPYRALVGSLMYVASGT